MLFQGGKAYGHVLHKFTAREYWRLYVEVIIFLLVSYVNFGNKTLELGVRRI